LVKAVRIDRVLPWLKKYFFNHYISIHNGNTYILHKLWQQHCNLSIPKTPYTLAGFEHWIFCSVHRRTLWPLYHTTRAGTTFVYTISSMVKKSYYLPDGGVVYIHSGIEHMRKSLLQCVQFSILLF
jgi:hypothetical protein